MSDVMIAVDPHKASNTAAVLDPVTKTLIETARFANTEENQFPDSSTPKPWPICHVPWSDACVSGVPTRSWNSLLPTGTAAVERPP